MNQGDKEEFEFVVILHTTKGHYSGIANAKTVIMYVSRFFFFYISIDKTVGFPI